MGKVVGALLMNKKEQIAIIAVLVANLCFLLGDTVQRVVKTTLDVTDYCVSEWLINYQGGFVRRGLLGELIYQACAPFDLDPRFIIVPLCIVFAALFCFLTIKYFRKNHLCLWILPTSYVLFGADFIRKDYLMMLLVWGILYMIPKIIAGRGNALVVILLSLFLLNVHEASFFIFFPILALYVLFGSPNKSSVWSRAAIIAAPLVGMAITCAFKGGRECAEAVCHSWTFAYPETYATLTVENAIGALTWETMTTIRMHLQYNFLDGPLFAYSGIIMRMVSIALILFLMVQIAFIRHRERADYMSNSAKFIKLALFQLLALSPMLVFLSCDYKRICFYWTTSCFISYFCLKDVRLCIPCPEACRRFICVICRWLASPVKPVVPFLLLAFLSVPFIHNRYADYMSPVVMRVHWHLTHISEDIERLTN